MKNIVTVLGVLLTMGVSRYSSDLRPVIEACNCAFTSGGYGVIAPRTPAGGETCSPVSCWYRL